MTRDTLLQALQSLPDEASLTLSVRDLRAALDGPSGADLTVPELAQRFGRAHSTIRSWLEAGVLRGYRLRGREWRVPLAAIAEFEQREREGRPRKPTSQRGVTNLGAWRGEKSA